MTNATNIPSNSRIHCACSDGSSYIEFSRLDGMYAPCRTERGGLVHLYAFEPLNAQPDGSYRLAGRS